MLVKTSNYRVAECGVMEYFLLIEFGVKLRLQARLGLRRG